MFKRLNDETKARRGFLKRCAASAFAVSMLPEAMENQSQLLAASAANKNMGNGFGKAKRVIYLMVSGGLTQVDTLDPKGGASKGPGKIIRNKVGGEFTSYIPKMADVADRMCVIRSMTGKIGTHKPAQYFMRTAYKESNTIYHPTLGAYAQQMLGPSHEVMPSSVCINRNAGFGNGFFASSLSPLPILDPDAGLQHSKPKGGLGKLRDRLNILNKLDQGFREEYPDRNVKAYTQFYDESIRLMDGKDADAFDLSKESEKMREAYGKGKFGQGCLLARRLIESGVRFVEVISSGWDFHKNLESGLEDLTPGLDQAYAQLVKDLEQRGLLDETLIVLTTEFGRHPTGSGGGRRHYPGAFSVALAGAGVKGGTVYGKTDKSGHKVVENAMTTGDLHATIGYAMGIDPEAHVMSPSGRPFKIGNKGKPVTSIMS